MQELTRTQRAGDSESAAAPCCAMVIYGTDGDLTKRSMVTALYEIVRTQQLPDQSQLIGITTTAQTTADWRGNLTQMMQEFVAHGGGEFSADRLDQTAWRWLTERMTYLAGDLNDAETYRKVGAQ